MEASRSARMRSSDSAPSTSGLRSGGSASAAPARGSRGAVFTPPMSCTRASEASLFARVEEAERLLGISRSLGYELPNEWIDTGGRTGLPGAPPSAAGSSSSARCWRSGQATQAPGSAPLPLSTPGRAVGELSNELLHVSSCCRCRHGLDTEGVAPTARSPNLDAVTACEVIEFTANTAGQRLRTPDKAAPTKTPHLSVVAPATPA